MKKLIFLTIFMISTLFLTNAFAGMQSSYFFDIGYSTISGKKFSYDDENNKFDFSGEGGLIDLGLTAGGDTFFFSTGVMLNYFFIDSPQELQSSSETYSDSDESSIADTYLGFKTYVGLGVNYQFRTLPLDMIIEYRLDWLDFLYTGISGLCIYFKRLPCACPGCGFGVVRKYFGNTKGA